LDLRGDKMKKYSTLEEEIQLLKKDKLRIANEQYQVTKTFLKLAERENIATIARLEKEIEILTINLETVLSRNESGK